MKKRLRPKKSASQPLIGSTIALETRYEVNTQVLSLLLAPRLPAMWGKATLAMSVSRTSIKAARATTIPISQGLNFGFQAAGAVKGVSSAMSLHFLGGLDRHPQHEGVG